MKIGIISDIHGNSLALDAVLKDFEIRGVEKVFCLGDLAMAGYDPNYTIETIKNLPNLEIIQGNTDKMIVEFDPEIINRVKDIPHGACMAHALIDDVKIIKKENIEYLASLPETKELELDDIKICLCHGTPRRQNENMFPDTPVNTVEEMVAGTNANLIFNGHTHLPCGFQLNSNKTVVNVGSVGRPMQEDKRPVYVLLETFGEGKFQLTHHFVQYDNKKAYDKIIERKFPECEELANMLIRTK